MKIIPYDKQTNLLFSGVSTFQILKNVKNKIKLFLMQYCKIISYISLSYEKSWEYYFFNLCKATNDTEINFVKLFLY